MIHAYREMYLDGAMSRVGDMFDYAVNDCGIPGEEFVKRLICSSVCVCLENGDPSYIAGKSGVEIATEILGGVLAEPAVSYERTPAHWCGWAAAYYQWLTNRRYAELFQAIPWQEMMRLYPALHETDPDKTAAVFDSWVKKAFPETNLKRLRQAYGCSQGELSKRSGVSLRSIQMYEQRNKDINKAHADTVLRLAKTLGCRMEDLIESA